MRITIQLAAFILAGMLTMSAQTSNPPDTTQTGAASSAGTLTGCLKGSHDQYYIVEKDGSRHTLMAKGQDLSQYVDHEVTLAGKADTSRTAPASGSDAKGNRAGFFSVDSVSDQGACKK